ncbi:aminotransferase class III-fold pyridoxal phosphate-dependent enzyme [Sorangium sp. So ce134]
MTTSHASGALDVLRASYRERFCASARLSEGAASLLAGGVTHDSWAVSPFAPVFHRAEGARKWDVDQSPFVDFWMGHGSLMLGHGHPDVVDALQRQLTLGFHLGGSSAVSHRWAAKIREMVPSVEKVRFTSSGTEATMLALRVARAFTGRQIIVRLDGHFHGWHDEAMAHLLQPRNAGTSAAVADCVRIASPLDLDSVREALEERDVAAVILEPGGGSGGILPFDVPFLSELRRLTREAGTLLIFDEVMSGFRYAPGGAQALAGVRPDLTVLAKILCGGLAGAAVGGSAEVMRVFGAAERPHGLARVMHSGTFNGNPLAAAAGLSTLALVGDGEAQRRAAAAADALAASINAAAVREGVDVRCFAQHSIFHLLIGAVAEGVPVEPSAAALLLQKKRAGAHAALRLALLLEGIDCHNAHGWLSIAHTDEVLAAAADGFARAFRRVRSLDEFGGV